MANPEHLKILKQGVEVWNKWREENPEVEPDLRESVLKKRNLRGFKLDNTNFYRSDLTEVDLRNANLESAQFIRANLAKVKFQGAILYNTNFTSADLNSAILQEARLFKVSLSYSNLTRANFSGAFLSNSDIEGAILIRVNFSNAVITESRIYGVSAWDIEKEKSVFGNLVITPYGAPQITVDDLEVAQFIYLMLNNQKIRDVIETITSKAVLILGRFTEERKAVLDALKDELRRRNYLPIVFDFENASNKSVDETVNLLARMSRFVVADITDAKSIPQELKGFVESNAIPVIPLILKDQSEYAMFDHFRKYPWVLDLHEYDSPEILLENIIPTIIAPAEQKVAELRGR